VVKALVRVIKDHLGLHATISGRKLTGEDVNGKGAYLQPDAEFYCRDMTIWIDFGSVVSTAPSNMNKDAVETYADEKFKKYEDLVKLICGQHYGQFYPVITDHFGTPHRHTLNFITSIAAFYRERFVGSPVEAPLSPAEVYRLLLETIVTELARGNFVRSNKWCVSHALSPHGPEAAFSSYRGPVGANGAPLSEALRIHPSCPEGAHGTCTLCPKAAGALTAQGALTPTCTPPQYKVIPDGGLAQATEEWTAHLLAAHTHKEGADPAGTVTVEPESASSALDGPAPPAPPITGPAVCSKFASPRAPSDNQATAMDDNTDSAAAPVSAPTGPGNPEGAAQDHMHSRQAPPADSQILPVSSDSLQSLSQAVEAPTGAPARSACFSPAPSVAHSSSPASENPPASPRTLASPAPPEHGEGGSQLAPAPTEGAGAPTGSVPPHPQHEDGSHLAVASLTPVSGGHPGPPPPQGQTRPLEALTPSPPPSPANTVVISDCRGSTAGVPRPAPAPLTARPEPHSLFRPCVCSCSELCVCSSFCVCLCVCSSHAPARHPASPVAPRPPDPVSPARFTVSHSSSPKARTATTAAHKESDGSAV
jgi:hypothetical protein